jgi:pyruvate,water dikinase
VIATAPAALADAHDERAFGGKAAGLAAAAAAGLPVPPGVALCAALVEAIAAGDRGAEDLARSALAGVAPPYAVRSSGVGEDSEGASFAGQHQTRLGVQPAELADAVRRVHASCRSDSAIAYRLRLGVAGEARMGIVVQTLVAAHVAGVMFTRNPLDGSDERVVEASWGLGTVVVDGRVVPDRYRIARGGEVLERVVGRKDLAVELLADGHTRECPVAPARAAAPCLDDAQLRALDSLAAACEELPGRGRGRGRDIEFAFADGTLHLLQSRPLTR